MWQVKIEERSEGEGKKRKRQNFFVCTFFFVSLHLSVKQNKAKDEAEASSVATWDEERNEGQKNHWLSDRASSFPSLLKAGSECLVSTMFFPAPNAAAFAAPW